MARNVNSEDYALTGKESTVWRVSGVSKDLEVGIPIWFSRNDN